MQWWFIFPPLCPQYVTEATSKRRVFFCVFFSSWFQRVSSRMVGKWLLNSLLGSQLGKTLDDIPPPAAYIMNVSKQRGTFSVGPTWFLCPSTQFLPVLDIRVQKWRKKLRLLHLSGFPRCVCTVHSTHTVPQSSRFSHKKCISMVPSILLPSWSLLFHSPVKSSLQFSQMILSHKIRESLGMNGDVDKDTW